MVERNDEMGLKRLHSSLYIGTEKISLTMKLPLLTLQSVPCGNHELDVAVHLLPS